MSCAGDAAAFANKPIVRAENSAENLARASNLAGKPATSFPAHSTTANRRPERPTAEKTIPLVPISEIPSPFRSFFPFSSFNRVQSAIFDDVFRSTASLVVSAPTGSGKTVVFELALLRLLLSNAIAVYVAPTKALCSEKYEDWKRRFGAVAEDAFA